MAVSMTDMKGSTPHSLEDTVNKDTEDLLSSDETLEQPVQSSYKAHQSSNVEYQYTENGPRMPTDHYHANIMGPDHSQTTDRMNIPNSHENNTMTTKQQLPYTGDVTSGRELAANYSEALSRSSIPSDGTQHNPYARNIQMSSGYSRRPVAEIFGIITTQPRNNTQPRESSENVPDYLCLSVISFLFCWILGGLAIRASIEARKEKKEGATEKAKESSKSALQLSIISIICGIILTAVLIFLHHLVYGVP